LGFAAVERGAEDGPRFLGQFQHGLDDLVARKRADWLLAGGAVGLAQTGPEDAHVVVDLGDRTDGGARGLAGGLVLDGDGGREADDVLDLWLLELAEELPGVGGERLDVAALALDVDRIHGEAGFAGTRDAGADGHGVAGDVDGDVLEVVFAGA